MRLAANPAPDLHWQIGVLLQIMFCSKKEMRGMGRFSLCSDDTATEARASWLGHRVQGRSRWTSQGGNRSGLGLWKRTKVPTRGREAD